MEGHLIYLSLGSNLGNRLHNLTAAREIIEKEVGPLQKGSGVYESAPWGYSSANHFYNGCLSLQTLLDPLPLLEKLLSLERSMGRVRGDEGYSDRVIDVDLLFYGNTLLDHPRLKIPHPALEKRRFVLAPLSEIAPELQHPFHGLSVREMLERCEDPGTVIQRQLTF